MRLTPNQLRALLGPDGAKMSDHELEEAVRVIYDLARLVRKDLQSEPAQQERGAA